MVAARRTAVMPRGGAFARLGLADLATPVIAACLADAGIAPGAVDELVLSNALGAGGNPARLVALAAGLPETVAGVTLDRQCAGGLDALLIARALILAGQADVVLAGGVESYSRRPLRLRTDPDGGPALAYDQPPFTPWPDRDPPMVMAAEALAQALGITRAKQDDWVVASHAKAMAAGAGPEIVALPQGSADGFARALTPALAARARVLAGSITAANAAVAADGAAFGLVVSDRVARNLPRALRLAAGATLGGRPEEPGLAPVAAIARALTQAGLAASDLALAEVMEAYAVQAIACVQGAGLDPARVNTGGGALARGHPVGASGAVLAVRLFHDLQAGYGLATIAAAGGIGTALVLQAE
nr:thiolase family protein [Fertoeibacter niger]